MRAKRSSILAGVIALVAALVVSTPAAAATTTQWADWEELTGSGGAFTSSVEIAAASQLSAAVTSDSRAGQVGVISGASTWLSEGTPVGAKYGSSRDQPYLNLRPKADSLSGTSTTTYSFENPTPTAGWAFVLGDIDADAVQIRAIGPDGQALTAAQLGFQGGFNYCAPGIAGKPSCTGAADDVPAWDAGTLTLTGNADATDTSGASAWFEPSAPISSLSFLFTRRSGFPVYQTWFASLARDISGTVRDDAGVPQTGVALNLTDADGTVVAMTSTAADGTYAFPGVVATSGYTVRVTAPADMIAEGPTTRTADLTETDAVGVDFVIRDIVPVAVAGRVVDGAGNPLSGVTVTVDGVSTTTDADGQYLFDTVPVGAHTVVVTPPNGYSTTDAEEPIVVPEGSEAPIAVEDFVLLENPDLGGAVRVNGIGLAGVLVTASAGGDTVTAVTDASGGYTFSRLPPGEYTIGITPPDGYVAAGPISREEEVNADVTDVDFELARLGALAGTVRTDAGAPVAGVVIAVTGGDGAQRLTSDADGAFGIGALPPGTYTLTVVPPDDAYTIVGAGTRTLTITAAGETVVDQDFVLAPVVVTPPPTDPPMPAGTAGTAPGGGRGTLPGTGLGPETFAWVAGGAVVLLLGAALLVVSRRRAGQRDDD